jgi:5'-nucleotidase
MHCSLRPRFFVRWVVIVVALTLFVSLISSVTAASKSTIDLQFLDVSDWHAQLDPLSVTGVGNVGGAAQLSTYFQADRQANPNTLTLTAGDAFGAAPPLSGFFAEEPAIKAMRLMGFDVDGFGNHNFDRGIAHLQSMIDLAGMPSSDNLPGKPFVYLAANLKNVDQNLNGVAPFKIFTLGGVKVGVVGITNPEAPTLVFPGRFGTIQVTDPIAAANKAKAQAKAAGAQIVVVITHMGITGQDVNGAPIGPLIDFANNVGGFDIIFGDHTDLQYSGFHNNALVVENKSKGATYLKVKLSVDPKNGNVVSSSVTFVTPFSSAVTPDPAIVSMLAPYRTALAALLDGQIGVASGLFPRGGSPSVERSGEAAIGDLASDAMRWRYGTQLALTNGGGLRSSLPSSYLPFDTSLRRTAAPYVIGPPFDLVIGDVYTFLPFGNSVLTRNVTGAQLWAALENGVSQLNPATCNGADGRFPQISGFKFAFSCSASSGSRVVSVALDDGTPILADGTSYTFATNDFVNAGGDFYTMFKDGQGVTREVMADVLLEYIKARTPSSPTLDGRITKLP